MSWPSCPSKSVAQGEWNSQRVHPHPLRKRQLPSPDSVLQGVILSLHLLTIQRYTSQSVLSFWSTLLHMGFSPPVICYLALNDSLFLFKIEHFGVEEVKTHVKLFLYFTNANLLSRRFTARLSKLTIHGWLVMLCTVISSLEWDFINLQAFLMHCIMSEITGFPQMNFSSFAEKGLIEKQS